MDPFITWKNNKICEIAYCVTRVSKKRRKKKRLWRKSRNWKLRDHNHCLIWSLSLYLHNRSISIAIQIDWFSRRINIIRWFFLVFDGKNLFHHNIRIECLQPKPNLTNTVEIAVFFLFFERKTKTFWFLMILTFSFSFSLDLLVIYSSFTHHHNRRLILEQTN